MNKGPNSRSRDDEETQEIQTEQSRVSGVGEKAGRSSREDDVTVKIEVPAVPRTAPPPPMPKHSLIFGDELLPNGRHIKGLLQYQLVSFHLALKNAKFYLVVYESPSGGGDVGKIKVVYAYPHKLLDPMHLQEATFVVNGAKYGYVPALAWTHTRQFIQKSSYFLSSDPPIVVEPTGHRLSGVIDPSEGRTIPPPGKMKLVDTYTFFELLLAAQEKSWHEKEQKALMRDR